MSQPISFALNRDLILSNISVEEFERVYIEYYPSLLAYARNFVYPKEAEDIVQDLMVWLWEKRKTLHIKSTLKGYLFLAIRNNCLTYISQNTDRVQLVDYFPENLKAIRHNVDYSVIEELSLKIEEALARLPENYRIVFEMNRFGNKTYNEIAVELGISTKTVEYRMSQALKNLRVELKDYLPLIYLLLYNFFRSGN